MKPQHTKNINNILHVTKGERRPSCKNISFFEEKNWKIGVGQKKRKSNSNREKLCWQKFKRAEKKAIESNNKENWHAPIHSCLDLSRNFAFERKKKVERLRLTFCRNQSLTLLEIILRSVSILFAFLFHFLGPKKQPVRVSVAYPLRNHLNLKLIRSRL